MNRAWIVAATVIAGSVANAAPESRSLAVPAAPAASAAPDPDGTGAQLRPAAADSRRIVGILEVRVEGVPDEVKESFQRRIEEQLDTKHYWLASRARMKQMMMRSTTWTEGCFVGRCITEVRRYTGADLVLLASLTGSGTNFGYVVTLVRTDTGRVLSQHAERCDVCTVNEVLDNTTQATMALLNAAPDKLPDETAERTATVDLAVGKVHQQLVARDRHARRVGLTLTAIGVAAAVAGVMLYELDDGRSYTVATAAGGGALALGGLAILTF